MHTYILHSTYTASDYTLTCCIVIDGTWLCMGLMTAANLHAEWP